MGERGLYNVNPSNVNTCNVNPRPRQNYFSFICSLLIFLLLLILIYLLSYFLKPSSTQPSQSAVIIHTTTHSSTNDIHAVSDPKFSTTIDQTTSKTTQTDLPVATTVKPGNVPHEPGDDVTAGTTQSKSSTGTTANPETTPGTISGITTIIPSTQSTEIPLIRITPGMPVVDKSSTTSPVNLFDITTRDPYATTSGSTGDVHQSIVTQSVLPIGNPIEPLVVPETTDRDTTVKTTSQPSLPDTIQPLTTPKTTAGDVSLKPTTVVDLSAADTIEPLLIQEPLDSTTTIPTTVSSGLSTGVPVKPPATSGKPADETTLYTTIKSGLPAETTITSGKTVYDTTTQSQSVATTNTVGHTTSGKPGDKTTTIKHILPIATTMVSGMTSGMPASDTTLLTTIQSNISPETSNKPTTIPGIIVSDTTLFTTPSHLSTTIKSSTIPGILVSDTTILTTSPNLSSETTATPRQIPGILGSDTTLFTISPSDLTSETTMTPSQFIGIIAKDITVLTTTQSNLSPETTATPKQIPGILGGDTTLFTTIRPSDLTSETTVTPSQFIGILAKDTTVLTTQSNSSPETTISPSDSTSETTVTPSQFIGILAKDTTVLTTQSNSSPETTISPSGLTSETTVTPSQFIGILAKDTTVLTTTQSNSSPETTMISSKSPGITGSDTTLLTTTPSVLSTETTSNPSLSSRTPAKTTILTTTQPNLLPQTTTDLSGTSRGTESTLLTTIDFSVVTTLNPVVTSGTTNDFNPKTTTQSQLPVTTASQLYFTSETTNLTSSTSTTQYYLPTVTTLIPNISTKRPEKKICQSTRCKRFASEMLAGVNHMKDPCSDFYEFACGGVGFEEDSYKKKLLENILKDINNTPKDFQTFYKSCTAYDSDFGDTRRDLVPPLPKDITELVTEMILYQTMHFFDIGLTFGSDGKFQFLVSPLPTSNFKTTLKRWSMIEKFKKQCEERYTIDMISSIKLEDIGTVRHKISDCLVNRITIYTGKYAKTIYAKYQNNEVQHLENIVKIHAKQITDPTITGSKNITVMHINDFKRKCNLQNINWPDVFKKLSNSIDYEVVTVQIQSLEYIEQLFKTFENIDILNVLLLWHHSQIFHNIIKDKSIHTDKYCLDITMELFPDVATSLIYKQMDVNKNSELIMSQFDVIVTKLNDSLAKKLKFDKQFQKKLQIKLERTELVRMGVPSQTENYYNNPNLKADDFLMNLEIMIVNFRQRLFSFVGKSLDIKLIAPFFIDPFDFKPKAFCQVDTIIYHPAFVQDLSSEVPEYIVLAKVVYPLAIELFKEFVDYYEEFTHYSVLESMQLENDNASHYGLTDNNTFAVVKDLIMDNAAYKLLTNLFEDHDYTTTLIFADPTFTIPKMFTIFASQSYCRKGIMEEKIYDFTAPNPSSIRIRNTAKNSEFFAKTFNCTLATEYSAQFPFVSSFSFS